jgi:hypothetical protein
VVDSSSYRDHAAAKSWHCRGVNVSFPNCFQNLTNPLLVHMTYLGTRVLEIVLIADDNHFHVSLEEMSRDKPFSVQQPISLIKLLTTFITSLEIYIMFIGYHVSVAHLTPQCNIVCLSTSSSKFIDSSLNATTSSNYYSYSSRNSH